MRTNLSRELLGSLLEMLRTAAEEQRELKREKRGLELRIEALEDEASLLTGMVENTPCPWVWRTFADISGRLLYAKMEEPELLPNGGVRCQIGEVTVTYESPEPPRYPGRTLSRWKFECRGSVFETPVPYEGEIRRADQQAVSQFYGKHNLMRRIRIVGCSCPRQDCWRCMAAKECVLAWDESVATSLKAGETVRVNPPARTGQSATPQSLREIMDALFAEEPARGFEGFPGFGLGQARLRQGGDERRSGFGTGR